MAMLCCSSRSSRLSQDAESVVKRLDAAFNGDATAASPLHLQQEGGGGRYGAGGCGPLGAPRLGSRYSLPHGYSKFLKSGLGLPVVLPAGGAAAAHIAITSEWPSASEADSPRPNAQPGSPVQAPATGSTWGSPLSDSSPDGQQGLDGETADPAGNGPAGGLVGGLEVPPPPLDAVVKQRSPVRDLTQQFEAATKEAAAGKRGWPSATKGTGVLKPKERLEEGGPEEEAGTAPAYGQQLYGLEAEFQREASEGHIGTGRRGSRLAFCSTAWDGMHALLDDRPGDDAVPDEERTLEAPGQRKG